MSLDISLYMVDEDGEEQEIYDVNITHNLNIMASEAGVYTAMWRPEEIGATKAKDLIPLLEAGLEKLKGNPDHFKQFNPENGWGSYDGLVLVVEEYLGACKECPESTIHTNR